MAEDASVPASGDLENETSSSESEGEGGLAVESLVVGREKRATAGNRMANLLSKEGDDDLELLFAENEEEEDVEFEDEDEAVSDAELDSSSDEDDQGPSKDENDLTGEKELQRQEKIERQKKRKAQDAFKRPSTLRKRVRIDPSTTPKTPAPRPKKKSERVSWVPSEADAPTRASSRKQTIQNREVIHERLVESEKTRLKVMQQMEEAARRKSTTKPKALTQADRLEEAAKTERKNAKSLNRWEEAEKKRQEEQKAKLEALRTRQLVGPVITWWSGLARWVNGKVGLLGVEKIRRAGFTEEPVVQDVQSASLQPNITPSRHPYDDQDQDMAMSGLIHPHALTESSTQLLQNSQAQQSQPQITFAPPQGPYGFLDGIHAYAALPMQQHHQQKPQAEFTGTAHGDPMPQAYPRPYSSVPQNPPLNDSLLPRIEYTSRNLVALRNIDANAGKLPEVHNSVLIKKPRKEKLQRSAAETCAITMQPARFRDPKTGLGYASSYAYKEIQRLRKYEARWSNLLDCYVGHANSPARGVPERFWKGP
ncbi:hypothetical protein MMC21_005024 [Puttea exsequens]|nr:hypothetical protein [Puttea exsequens]